MPHYFAIVPAAGNSTRMGEPKLMLPIKGGTIISRTLEAWGASRVERVVVVARSDDDELAGYCRSWGVEVVVPRVAPSEMKDSVQHGLRHIEAHFAPTAEDAWLLAPADMPNLSPRVINHLLESHRQNKDEHHNRILIPTLSGKRGHPVLFPWTLADEVHALGENEGLNALRKRHESQEIPCDAIEPAGSPAFSDIDTPGDYQRLRE